MVPHVSGKMNECNSQQQLACFYFLTLLQRTSVAVAQPNKPSRGQK